MESIVYVIILLYAYKKNIILRNLHFKILKVNILEF